MPVFDVEDGHSFEMRLTVDGQAREKLRADWDDGQVEHYAGEHGAERLVRQVAPDGYVEHYAGEAGAERQVRQTQPDGSIVHFKGEQGAERPDSEADGEIEALDPVEAGGVRLTAAESGSSPHGARQRRRKRDSEGRAGVRK